MARIIFALAAYLIPGALCAGDTLLVFDGGWLASADPRTGGVLQYHVQIQGSGLAYDPAHNVVYTIVSNPYPNPNVLSAINTQTLHVTSVPLTGLTIGQSPDSLAYDSVAGVLYATYGYNASSNSQLFRIDTQSGMGSVAATFSGVGVTALTFDRVAGALYGTATPGGSYQPTGPPRVIRIDTATGTLTTLYTGRSTTEFHDLAFIPGTQSFYTRTYAGLFARLDTATGTITTLGRATNTAGQLFQDFDFPVTPPLGPLSYSVQDICAPVTCAAQLLNDRGTVAGQIAGSGSSLFVASAKTGVVLLPGTDGLYPSSMNNDEDIVGSTANRQAFLYSRSKAQVFNLNTVFGWTSGSANHINNRGDITGNPDSGAQQTIDGFAVTGVLGITDTGILVAWTQSGGGLVLFPGGPAYQSTLLPFVFNNSGQFLTFTVPGNPLVAAGGGALVTPGAGVRAVPGTLPLYVPISMNDSGIAIFGGSIVDASGAIPELSTPVPLFQLVPPSTGWSRLSPVAVNNAGQILASGTNNSTGAVTSLLLTPNMQTAAAQTTGARLMRTTPGCGAERLNGAPFDCSKLLRISPRRDGRD